ncbi:MAG: thiamine biosynthesis protein ThiS [Desulfobacterales bacterium]|nr:MoaD/ThiS family protein [Deltaproteobacteria bacterium]NNL42370.1 thiamine biosynthesis protein ThiS [Desulfobacterales bacterium]
MVKVGDKNIAWYEKMTVEDLLNDLNDPYHYVVVRINKKYISRPDFSKTLVPDHSEVFLIPMISGG